VTPTPICDLLDSVIGVESHATRPSGRAGGEWDQWRALPRRHRRVLIGAGFATPHGMAPDVLADFIIARRCDGAEHYDEALAWFYRTALAAVRERRAAANRDRHERVAKQHGQPTYYAHRTEYVRQLGHASLWHYRKAKEWT